MGALALHPRTYSEEWLDFNILAKSHQGDEGVINLKIFSPNTKGKLGSAISMKLSPNLPASYSPDFNFSKNASTRRLYSSGLDWCGTCPPGRTCPCAAGMARTRLGKEVGGCSWLDA